MPVNFQALGPLQPQQQMAPTPLPQNPGGGGGGLGGIFKALAGVAGGFESGSNDSPAPSGAYSNAAPSQNPGTALQSQQMNPAQPFKFEQMRNPGLTGIQGAVNSSSLFDNALKQVGVKETDPTLKSYLQKANPNLDPRTTPWCAGFVGSVLNASGLKGTNSLMAKSYLDYGSPIDKPGKGDIAVLNRGSDPRFGHVGFVQSVDYEKGMVNVLGGNQDNSVSIKAYPLSQVAGFRAPPTGEQVQQFAQQRGIQSPQQLSSLTKPQFNPEPKQQQPKKPDLTLDLIKQFEGYYEKPYWDVNAYRAGYGSDTTTTADGRVIPIQKGVMVDRDSSERDLRRRVGEFQNTVRKQIGDEVWGSLPMHAQSALTSIAYNYGSLPKRIIGAVKSGDLNAMSEAVRGLGSDNKGINKHRRNREADLILGKDIGIEKTRIPGQQSLNSEGQTPLNPFNRPQGPAWRQEQRQPTQPQFPGQPPVQQAMAPAQQIPMQLAQLGQQGGINWDILFGGNRNANA